MALESHRALSRAPRRDLGVADNGLGYASAMRHRETPCSECPWRRDAPPGQFPRERYEELRATVGAPGEEVSFDAPMFACHKSIPGGERPCAGWLAVVGYEHIGVRLAVNSETLPASVLRPGDDWPELYDSYEEMVSAQAAQPDS